MPQIVSSLEFVYVEDMIPLSLPPATISSPAVDPYGSYFIGVDWANGPDNTTVVIFGCDDSGEICSIQAVEPEQSTVIRKRQLSRWGSIDGMLQDHAKKEGLADPTVHQAPSRGSRHPTMRRTNTSVRNFR